MSYKEAKSKYAKIGIDTEKVIADLGKISISLHCWQGDDVGGFETTGGASGGIQTTGNYPGKARTPAELMQDLSSASSPASTASTSTPATASTRARWSTATRSAPSSSSRG